MDFVTAFLSGTLENVFAFGIMVIVTLAIVIMIHEWGHYIAARMCGVHVEQFSFGLGKELFGFGDDPKKTRFSICVFPLGGFVKIFGDVDVNNPVIWDHENDCERKLGADELRVAFCTKSVWQRIFIVIAGPITNILLTFILLVSLFTTYGVNSLYPVVNAIPTDSAAYEAGVQIGDRVIAMDGQKIRRLDDIFDAVWYEDPPIPKTYTIIRDGQKIEITFPAKRIQYETYKGVRLDHGITGFARFPSFSLKNGINTINTIDTKGNPDKARALIVENFDRQVVVGLAYMGPGKVMKTWDFIVIFPEESNTHLFQPDHEQYNRVFLTDPREKEFLLKLGIVEATHKTALLLKEGVINSYKVIEASFHGRNDDRLVSGIPQMTEKIAIAVKTGFYEYVLLLATISFMIGFINLLPIPVLDGGYLLFLFYEIIRGKPVSPRIQGIAMIIGLIVLGGIMVFANVSDLLSLLSNVSSD